MLFVIFVSGGKYYYGFRIVNGKMATAGTFGADVYFNLIGDKASTGNISIYDFWHYICGGISSNTFLDFIVETEKSLGEVLVVILGIDGGKIALDSTWFVSYTVAYELSTKVEIQFPCYHWIGKDTSVSTTSKTSEFACLHKTVDAHRKLSSSSNQSDWQDMA